MSNDGYTLGLKKVPADTTGLFTDDPGAMTTATGRKLNPLTMTEDDVDIIDIATSLARQCRYNGHVGSFLSVARHSMAVAEMLPPKLKLAGLLHDAAEAYLGDLVRPLKHGTFGDTYLLAEARVERVIFRKFGLPYPIPAEVIEADSQVLRNELEFTRWSFSEYNPYAEARRFLRAFDQIVRQPQVFGLSGRKQSGKSEAGKVFIEMGCEEVHVGNEILAELRAMDVSVTANGGVTLPLSVWEHEYHMPYEWLKAETTLRQQLIDHGLWQRAEDPDYWLKKTLARVKPGGRYVFTSVRFPNEADAIRDLGGEVWRINRRGYNPADGADETETAMDDYPHYARLIHNAGTDLPGFHRLVRDLALMAGARRQVP